MNRRNNYGLVLVVIGLTIAGCRSAPNTSPPPDPLPAVQMTQPEAASLVMPAFSGVTKPHKEFLLSFQIDGRLDQRTVKLGDAVEPEQLLFKLDSHDLNLRLEQTQSVLFATSQSLSVVHAELTRVRELHQGGIASDTQLDELLAQQAKAESAYRQAQAAQQLARNQLSYAEIRSPVGGVVLDIKAESGMIVSAGQPIVAVASNATMDIEVDFPESWLPPPLTGMAKLANGEVYTVALHETPVQADPGTRAWRARYTIDGKPPDGFGRLVQLQFDRQGKGAKLMSLPITALDERGRGPQIWQLRGNRVLPIPIELHQILADRFVFSAYDIDESHNVAAAGTHRLQAGMAIRPIRAD